MDVAALILWVTTAIGGLAMAGMWLTYHGPDQHAEGHSRIGPTRLGLHAALAAVGLIAWIIHLVTRTTVLGWIALAVLPFVAGIGLLMFVTWLAGRGAVPAAVVPAEQRFPPVVVAAHGFFAVLTVAAVLAALVT